MKPCFLGAFDQNLGLLWLYSSPWDRFIAVYGSQENAGFKSCRATARQYNARLMD